MVYCKSRVSINIVNKKEKYSEITKIKVKSNLFFHQTISIPSSFALSSISKANFFLNSNVYMLAGRMRASIEHGNISFCISLMLIVRSTEMTHMIAISFLIRLLVNSSQMIFDHLPFLSAGTSFESKKRCTNIG